MANIDFENILLFDILNVVSGAFDLISETVVGHHIRVAYISSKLAEQMGFTEREILNLIYASLVHDTGIFYLNQSFSDLSIDKPGNLHAEVGYRLLKNYFPIKEVPELVRYHHLIWNNNTEKVDSRVKTLSNVLYLADRIAININDGEFILPQVSRIKQQINTDKGDRYCPEAVASFNKMTSKEYFWLELINRDMIENHLLKYRDLCNSYLDIDQLLDFGLMISHIIDFRSPFTATHSQGLAGVSRELARNLNFSASDLKLIQIASYFHDLGKLAVPLEILEKKGKLNEDEWQIMKAHSLYSYRVLKGVKELQVINEWGSLHHEKLNGNGYPFHLKGKELSTGSRIMCVSDIFTAITEDRPYRKKMSKDKVKQIMANNITNGSLDEDIVSIIIDNINLFYDIRQSIQQKAEEYYHQFRVEIENRR